MMFEERIYIERREKLKKQFQTGKLLFLGNDECGINYADNTYYYRQDSTFLYYFGISKPDLTFTKWVWPLAVVMITEWIRYGGTSSGWDILLEKNMKRIRMWRMHIS